MNKFIYLKLISITFIISILSSHSYSFQYVGLLRSGGFTYNLLQKRIDILSPDDFFGFQLTADRVLVNYEQLLEYYKYLAKSSKNLLLEHVGYSTEGKDMYQLVLSSRKNINNLEAILLEQSKIADPRNLPKDRVLKIIENQPIILFIGLSIHANEITATQMAPLFIYEILNMDREYIEEVMDKIILVISVTINPDGLDSVTHWYWDTLGSPSEGTTPPYLYQKYAGHDNNRDYFMNNLNETRVWSTQLFKRLFPVIVYDIHEMGPTGPRFFVPPFHDPANPAIPSTTIRDIELIGGAVSSHLAEFNLPGIVTNGIYDMWWHGGLRPAPNFHNQIGILTEAARVNIATPIEVNFDDLIGRLGIPTTKGRYINFTDVWNGGTWHSSDIATYEMETLKALIEVSIKYRKDLIRRFYERNVDAIELGRTNSPYGYIFNIDENDRGKVLTLMEILNFQGIELHVVKSLLNVEGETYPPNSFIVFLSQPQRQNILALLEKQSYPPRFLYPGGPPEAPYDIASWNLLEQMDIKAKELNQPFPAFLMTELEKIEPTIEKSARFQDTPRNRRIKFLKKLEKIGLNPVGQVVGVAGHDGGYIFTPDDSNFAIVVNRLFKEDINLYKTTKNVKILDKIFPPNSYVVPADKINYKYLEMLAHELAINFYGFENINHLTLSFVSKKRVALYESYNANYPTGWTSFVLDSNEFEYKKIYNSSLKLPDLKKHYDVIIFGSESYNNILNGQEENYPEKYIGGIGNKGVENLKNFVKDGGTLLLIDKATDLAIEGFKIPVINILKNLPEEEFYCPGSVLNLVINKVNNPLLSGYAGQTYGYFKNSATFEVLEKGPKVLATWPSNPDEILASGWMEGESIIAGKPAILDVPLGEGHVILTAFDIIHRGQPHATFKLLFNVIYADFAQ